MYYIEITHVLHWNLSCTTFNHSCITMKNTGVLYWNHSFNWNVFYIKIIGNHSGCITLQWHNMHSLFSFNVLECKPFSTHVSMCWRSMLSCKQVSLAVDDVISLYFSLLFAINPIPGGCICLINSKKIIRSVANSLKMYKTLEEILKQWISNIYCSSTYLLSLIIQRSFDPGYISCSKCEGLLCFYSFSVNYKLSLL